MTVFASLYTVYFDLRVLCESDLLFSCLLEATEKLTEMNTFQVDFPSGKIYNIFHFWIRLRFQGFRFKSDIVIFTWRVKWNYAHSPFYENRSKITPPPPLKLIVWNCPYNKIVWNVNNSHNCLLSDIPCNSDLI